MQVGPQDAAADFLRGLQHVVMIVPVDADEDEAQDVAEEYRDQGLQGGEIMPLRHFHLQHHDGDDDGDHAVTEGFEASLVHFSSWWLETEHGMV